jgi:ubiquitin-protein ligase
MQLPLICLCINILRVEWNPRCMVPRYLCSFTSMLGR